MCGRFTQAAPGEVVAALFELPEVPVLAPRYNIAPTQDVAAVRLGAAGGRELVALRWGLLPSWARDRAAAARMVNARAETLVDKPAFRAAFRARRCLIVADGFYEWRRRGAAGEPYYFARRDARPFGFAGLWERWQGEGSGPVESCTIITTAANETVAPVHDRMPVILDAAEFPLWLDPEARDPEALAPLLRPRAGAGMRAYPVSALVNDPRNDVPACREPLAAG
ncbi:MAG: SOS response-associated peptidase [Acidobacteria bacterium]|nr:MAG: SOS response-associated peptidase [Acidobacteriota bacterium]